MSNAATATRTVACELSFEVLVESVLALHVAVSDTQPLLEERFRLAGPASAGSGAPVLVAADHGGRIQLVRASPGVLDVSYSATVGHDPGAPRPAPGLGIDQLVALRQSRYCPSDSLAGFAATTFGPPGAGGRAPGARDPDARDPDAMDPDAMEVARRIASWVFKRLAYEPGVSRPTDTAVDTLLGGSGVCRDFAHLTITLCRAVGVPARLVSVYAPGLSPMDFHAVAEVWSGTAWEIVDATRLAPRSSLVRIATGRDAADTAFATTVTGDVRLLATEVRATVEGDLPADDHVSPSTLG
ncbi:MAG: transglutaminase family protein [Acidimicrobiia bacterium]